MTRLPERRDPDARQPLKPRTEGDAVGLTKLPEQRRADVGDRQVLKPRTTDAVGFTKLPEGRHSEREVMEIRRREAMKVRPPLAHLRAQMANPFVLGIGYLLAAGGGAGCYFIDKQWQHAAAAEWGAAGAGCAGMLVAVFLAFKKPRSRHHAAFIAMISLLVIVFGILCAVQIESQSHAT